MANFQKVSSGIQLSQLATTNRPSSPVNGMIYYDSTLNLFQLYQNSAWTGTASGTVNSGTAHRLALYPSSGSAVGDTDTQNSQPVTVALTQSATRTAALAITFPNPGDAITGANVLLDQGAQTVQGAMTFAGAVIVQGNFTVTGTTTYVNSTNTNISDAFITLNKGGAAGSASAAGLDFEENSIITAYVRTSANRLGYDIKAPATAGIATLVTPAANQTYTLPAKSGTFMLNVIDDSAPQLGGNLDTNGNVIKTLSNLDIVMTPNGTGGLARGVSTSRYVREQYLDQQTLTSNTTAVLSALTFNSTTIKAVQLDYMIVDTVTNARRTGKLLVVGDGASGTASSNVSLIDTSVETADPGVSWAAAISGNNIQLSYTTTTNAKSMNADVKQFLA